MIDDFNCTATGVCAKWVPAGDERERLLGLLRIGVSFANSHVGKRVGFFHRHLKNVVSKMHGDVTFDALIDRLENSINEPGSPIEQVNKKYLFVVYCDPKHGRKEATFKTIRNHLTTCKK